MTRSGSTPKDSLPAITSPLSFKRMRRYLAMGADSEKGVRRRTPGLRTSELLSGPFGRFGRVGRSCLRSTRVAHLEANEAGNRHVLAEFRDLLLDHVVYRHRVFLDERLIEEAHLF